MKANYFVFLLIIIQVHLYLRTEKRKELLEKLTEKISLSNINDIINDLNNREDDYLEDSFHKMNYNVDEIKALMKQYNLPESYDFFAETGVKKDVKNQANCGCCWSFSSTSALAYRYNKKLGTNISLSSQDGVSCYKGDCDGMNLLDPQLNLVKNGTLTEGCFPFTSSDGQTIPKCPNECQDGSEFKKYHSQNSYYASNSKQEYFKELVLLVMDQLVTEGPIFAGFMIHNDFEKFGQDKNKCKNDVYTYDGKSIEREIMQLQ